MLSFSGTVEGKLRNTKLPSTKGIYAVYEAVVNALQSIEDSPNRTKGYINIIIKRQSNLLSDVSGEIDSIIIEDNGNGFNDENLTSFTTSDSTYKFKKGCKGIGRFLWLLVFDNVHIDSTYDKGKKNVSFDFLRSKNSINETFKDVNKSENKTIISLNKLRSEYIKSFPHELDKFSSLIIEHCFLFFMENTCPIIKIIDGDNILNLNEIYNSHYTNGKINESFEIKGKKFNTTSIKLYDTITQNKIIYTANRRNILSIPLAKNLPALSEKIRDNDSNYYYNVIVSSDYLDDNICQDQMQFSIPEKPEEGELDFSTVYFEDIQKETINTVKKQLANYLAASKEKKKNKIEEYIKKRKPGYRVFLDRINDNKFSMDELKNNPTFSEIESYLHGIKFMEEKALLSLENKLKNNKKLTTETINTYRNLLQLFISKSTGIGICELANYICHRKATIEVMDKLTHINDKNKFSLEDELHSLLIPMKICSNDKEFQSNNLWLVDERMVFHEMLYSDTYIDSIKNIIKSPDKHSDKRPDIMIFDTPLVYADDTESFNSISIIELKRPQRDNYDESDNPYNEIIRQIDQLINSKFTSRGVPIEINENTRFFVYILADITKSLRGYLDRFLFKETCDKKGMYLINTYKKHDICIEVIPYKKLISDARKRNEVLFKTLGLIG